MCTWQVIPTWKVELPRFHFPRETIPIARIVFQYEFKFGFKFKFNFEFKFKFKLHHMTRKLIRLNRHSPNIIILKFHCHITFINTVA